MYKLWCRLWDWAIATKIEVTVTSLTFPARVEAYYWICRKWKLKHLHVPEFIEMKNMEPDYGQIQAMILKYGITHVNIEWPEALLHDSLKRDLEGGNRIEEEKHSD